MMIDAIVAQYAQGSGVETLIEATDKKVDDLEEKIAGFEEDLREVKDLEALKELKEKYLGPPSHLLTFFELPSTLRVV